MVVQSSSCSQTSEETVKNISHNSDSSCNSSVKNDVTDGSDALMTPTNKLNANYDIEFKSEIDDNDSTSPRSLRIAEHDIDAEPDIQDKDESMCFDEEDERFSESKSDNQSERREHSIDLSLNKQNVTESEDKGLNGDQNRVFRIESCDQNPIKKTLISDSHSL